MHFGFALDLSDIDLLNVDLLDQRYTHLDLFVSKTSWRRLQDMSSRRLQDMSSRRLQDMSSRRLQDIFSVTIFVFQDVLKMSSRRLQDVLRDVFRTFSRRLQHVLEDKKLLYWRHVEDVFKTSCRPTIACWDNTSWTGRNTRTKHQQAAEKYIQLILLWQKRNIA